MKIRSRINSMFDGKAFKRPLFYNYEGGLRFELSEGGDYLNQFVTAHRKGMEICQDIFTMNDQLTICIKLFGRESLLSCLSPIRELNDAGLFPLVEKEHWTEFDEEWVEDEEYREHLWHYIAFNASSELVLNALWCAFSSDFECIAPSPSVTTYLFNFHKEIMVLPYDDRGMDIVGPNSQYLKGLYHKFGRYLLEHDRKAMDASFS